VHLPNFIMFCFKLSGYNVHFCWLLLLFCTEHEAITGFLFYYTIALNTEMCMTYFMVPKENIVKTASTFQVVLSL